MNENRKIRNELLAQQIIKGLKSRHMNGYYAESKEAALDMALKMIPEGSTIGWGGSMSIAEVGLKQAYLTEPSLRIRQRERPSIRRYSAVIII